MPTEKRMALKIVEAQQERARLAGRPMGSRNATSLDLAIGVAESYRKLMGRGNVVLAEQALRTIDELVGGWDWDPTKTMRAWRRPEPVQKIIDGAW